MRYMGAKNPQLMIALVTIVALAAGLVIGGLYFGALSTNKAPGGTITVISNVTKTVTETLSPAGQPSGAEAQQPGIPGLSVSWDKVEELASQMRSVARPTPVYVVAPTTTVTVLKEQTGSTPLVINSPMQLSSQAAQVSLPGGEKLYYSGTNVQVRGVDEPDIVKTNGTHIFLVHGSILEIYRAYPAKKLSMTQSIDLLKLIDKLAGKEYLAIVSGNKTTIISTVKRSVTIRGLFVHGKEVVVLAAESRWPGPLEPRTWIIVLSGDGKVVHYATASGYPYDARLSNTTLVVTTSLGNIVRPIIILGAGRGIVPPPVLVGAPTVQTIVTAINLRTWNASTISFIGASPSSLYMTASGDVYVVLPGSAKLLRELASMPPKKAAEELRKIPLYRYYENSTILHLKISKGAALRLVAEGSVPGRIWKQWMLDVYNGTLRIVTENWEEGLHISLYILDAETLKPIGKLEDIALHERVHAVRFLGNTLYLVTYRNIDPLFAIDLSNPAKPRVIGFVKSPGFDEYLHPLSNRLLVGVGREDQWVRLTLYMVEDNKSVTIVQRLYLKGYRWSPVLDRRTGHRAFTLDPLHGYILLPVRSWGCPYSHGGVAVVKISAEKPGMKLLGILGHRYADRAIFIDDAIYTIAVNNPVAKVKAFDAKNLREIAEAPKPMKVSIAEILQNPENYIDKAVLLRGIAQVWKNLGYEPPVSKSDWVLEDHTGAIYVAAYTPYYCRESIPPNGAEIEIIGIVKMGANGHPYILPFQLEILAKK